MVNDEEFDFNESIGQKVLELEAEKQKIERHLGYAKMIKLTGRFPVRPKEMGKVKFEEFQREAIEGWNIVDDPQGADHSDVQLLVKLIYDLPGKHLFLTEYSL